MLTSRLPPLAAILLSGIFIGVTALQAQTPETKRPQSKPEFKDNNGNNGNVVVTTNANTNARIEDSQEGAEAEKDDPFGRAEWFREWFGPVSNEYLDYKTKIGEQEIEKWGHMIPGTRKYYKRRVSANDSLPPNQWVSIGPFDGSSLQNTIRDPNVADTGRPTTILPHPTNPNVIYVGFAGGGLWRCQNADLATNDDWVWEAMTDGLPVGGNTSIGAAAFKHDNPNTIYLSLGDMMTGSGGGGTAVGRGFYISNDGGETWARGGELGGSSRTKTVISLPNNVILVAGNAGLFRSTNGGASFALVQSGPLRAGAVWDILKLDNNRLVLTYNISGGGIAWSEDNGATWTSATISSGTATAPASFGRIAIAAYGNTLYGLYQASGSSFPQALLKSEDGGKNWVTNTANSLFQGNYSGDGSQAGYNHMVAVDPENPNVVFVGTNLSVYRSTDGGANFSQFTSWLGRGFQYTHADMHVGVWTPPGRPKALYLATDGGLSIIRQPNINPIPTGSASLFLSNPEIIDHRRNRGLATHLVYNLGGTNAATPAGARNRVVIGLQDNGTLLRKDVAKNYYDYVIGGDGFGCLIHPCDGNLMLGSLYNTRIQRTTNGGLLRADWADSVSGIDRDGDPNGTPFYTRLTQEMADPTGNRVYTFTNTVPYVSNDFGQSWTPLETTSASGWQSGQNIRNIGASPFKERLIGAAFSNRVAISGDGGQTWRTTASIFSTGSLSDIAFDTQDPNIIYVSSVANAQTSNHLWKSMDGGYTWAVIDGSQTNPNGIPFGTPIHVVKVDPLNNQIVYAGTDYGVYYTTNQGATWERFGYDLPLASVWDIYIAPDGSFMRIGTHGRGVWEIRTEQSEVAVSLDVYPKEVRLLPGGAQTFKAVTGYLSYDNANAAWSATGGTITQGGLYTAPNTPGTYTVTATSVEDATKSDTAMVTVVDASVVISPKMARLAPGAAQNFMATVTGLSNTSVAWSATGGGTITQGGLYTAGATLGQYQVSARSVELSGVEDAARVHITGLANAKVYEYDLEKRNNSGYSSETAWFSNVFTATGNDLITDAAFYANAANAAYEITIKTGVTGNPNTGVTVFGPMSGTLGGADYHEIKLTSPVNIANGDKFAVIVKMTTPGYNFPIPNGNIIDYEQPDACFVSSNGTAWAIRPAAGGIVVCLKAFAMPNVAPQPISVIVSPKTATLPPGGAQTFNAAVTGGLGNRNVTWSATGGSITQSGAYTAPNTPGTYTVRATSVEDNTKSDTATVTVVNAISVSVSPKTVTLTPGAAQTFTANVTGGHGNTSVTWSATGGTITQSGVYTAPNAPGTYTVRATSVEDNTKSDTATVTVVNAISVSVSPKTVTLTPGAAQTFTANVTGGHGNTSVTWSATGGTITQNGAYTAPNTPGTYTVRATSVEDNTKSDTATVTVVNAISVSVSPKTVALTVGGAQTFSANVTGGHGNTSVTWSATGGTITQSGAYTAPNTPGTYTVRATSVEDNAKSDSATVTVVDGLAVNISPKTVTLKENGAWMFNATVTGGHGNTAVTWSATGGTITQNGLYTAPNTPGTYTVRATSVEDNTKSDTATVTVVNGPDVSVVISPKTARLAPGAAQNFMATVTGLSDTSVAWSATGGTITQGGLYTAGATLGQYQVSARSVELSGVEDAARVHITGLADAKVYEYDLLGTNYGALGYASETIWFSNVFTATGNDLITDVAFYTDATRLGSYEITIKTGVTGDPNTGVTVFGPMSGTLDATDYPAYHEIRLTSPVNIANGDKFAVIVKITSSSGNAYVSRGDGQPMPGACFTSSSGTSWAEQLAENNIICLKAFAIPNVAPQPISVMVLPKTATLPPGGTQTFNATVTGGAGNTNVTWSVVTANGGSITQSGLYTAPATSGTYTIRATSAGDASKWDEATVTVVNAISVSVSPKTVRLTVGGAQTFSASVTGGYGNTSVTWTATGGNITQSGFYTAPNTPGTYTVTATSVEDNTKSDSATATVADGLVVNISPKIVTLTVGGTQTFSANVTGGHGNTNVAWSAAGGTITQGGVYTAPNTPGTYTVTATSLEDATKSDTATVTVVNAIAVSVSPKTVTLTTGATQTFSATVTGGAGNTNVTWAATGGVITQGGLYAAPSTPGAYTIIATSVEDNTKSDTATVTVVNAISVSVSPKTVTLTTGATQTFSASVTGGTGNTAVTWQATGGTITQNGLYTAPNTQGTYTVTATSVEDATKSDTATVTVNPANVPVTGVSLNKAATTLIVGDSEQLTATILPSDATNKTVIWQSSNSAVASVVNGLVTAIAQGTATIMATAQDGGHQASCVVAVAAGVTGRAIILNAPGAMFPGDTVTLQANITGLSNTAVAWAASAGTIDQQGRYTAPSSSSAQIVTIVAASVQEPSISASAQIRINNPAMANFDGNTPKTPQLLGLANAFGSRSQADLNKYDLDNSGIVDDGDSQMLFRFMGW